MYAVFHAQSFQTMFLNHFQTMLLLFQVIFYTENGSKLNTLLLSTVPNLLTVQFHFSS